jgi:hypothetical protein
MQSKWIKAALLGAAFLVGGCSFADNALLPSLGGSSTSGSTVGTPANTTGAPTGQVAAGQPGGAGTPTNTTGAPKLGTGNFQPEPVAPGKPTGTAVGQKVEAMRGDLTRLNASVGAQNQTLQALRAQSIQNAVAYHWSVASINAQLEPGTTPGNPILVKQWNDAQGHLGKVNDMLSAMSKLANDAAASAAMSNFLLESTRATFGISGAADEDHAQLLVLEDEVNKTSILIDRMLDELAVDISSQTNYLSEERANLNTLAVAVNSGEFLGKSLASEAYPPPLAPAMAPGTGIASGRPLVVIRFDRPNVDYQQPLYQAVSQALARRPNVAFDLVAVASTGSGTAQTAINSNMARRNADQVLRSLIGMGLPPERVSVTSATSGAARVNEVHLYVR